ncbi:kinesin-4-like, partial [Trifolium medium]|nr:kinesin-4-like [Trifolium medium]
MWCLCRCFIARVQEIRNSMPQETSLLSSIFASPASKRILNLKGSVFNNSEVNEEINDYELAYRKAEEA